MYKNGKMGWLTGQHELKEISYIKDFNPSVRLDLVYPIH